MLLASLRTTRSAPARGPDRAKSSRPNRATRVPATDIQLPAQVASSTQTSKTVAGIAAVFLFITAGLLYPIPAPGPWAYALGDLTHAPLFGCLLLIVLAQLDRMRPLNSERTGARLLRLLAVATCLFLFGIAIELAQRLIGRNAAIHDAAANGLGIAAAGLWYLSTQLGRSRPQRAWLRCGICLAAAALIGLASWHPVAQLCGMIIEA